MKSMPILLIIALSIFFTPTLFAQVPVAVMPIQGEGDTKKLNQEIRRTLAETGGLSIIGDNELKQIIDLHEKAQALGSESLDVSKIKVAEYIVKTSLLDGKASVSVIAVNTNIELSNTTFQFDGTSAYGISLGMRPIRDAIMFDAYSSDRKLPSGTEPYMKALRELVQSLGIDDKASYPYLAFYSSGSYRHPEPGNKKLETSAKVMLGEMKPRISRAKLVFAGISPQQNTVTIYVFADKMGKKTKHKFDFMDLPDGTIGITQYQPLP